MEDNNKPQSTKRKRACDLCRRKQLRCDGVQDSGQPCFNCKAYNAAECTYVQPAKRRKKSQEYLDVLEESVAKMEALYSQSNYPKLPPAPLPTVSIDPPPKPAATPHAQVDVTTRFEHDRIASHSINGEDTSDLTQALSKLSLNPRNRFFGESSSDVFVESFLPRRDEHHRPDGPKIPTRRPEFWKVLPWELATFNDERPDFKFPEEDLMNELVDLYFFFNNSLIPLLHRPTFKKEILEGLHWRETGFAEVLLLVCAMGSRYSTDPRCYEDGVLGFPGQKWHKQITLTQSLRPAPPSLYDLQKCCLSCMYMHGQHAASWTTVSIGLRMAQEVGAHRQKSYSSTISPTEELWRRVFWALVCIDRFLSSLMGQTCAIRQEDFDVDFPTEVDDEYWYHQDPDKAFQQPLGKPSSVSVFVTYLKLNQIVELALRNLYSLNTPSAAAIRAKPQWARDIVAKLEELLLQWFDEVPAHLRWDPNREEEQLMNQSAFLHLAFYRTQILVHHSFEGQIRKSSPLLPPSRDTWLQAARSCIGIATIQNRRSGAPLLHAVSAIFNAGCVTILNCLKEKLTGDPVTADMALADVVLCVVLLRHNEKRWPSSKVPIYTLETMMATYHVIQPQRRDPHSAESNSESPESNPSMPISSSHESEVDSDSVSPQASMDTQARYTPDGDGMWAQYDHSSDSPFVSPYGQYSLGHKAEWESSLDMFGLSERMAIAENQTSSSIPGQHGWDAQLHQSQNEQAFIVDQYNNVVPTTFSTDEWASLMTGLPQDQQHNM